MYHSRVYSRDPPHDSVAGAGYRELIQISRVPTFVTVIMSTDRKDGYQDAFKGTADTVEQSQ